jgi:hypothetical protein
MLAGVLADIDSQIKDLETQILDKERWEQREEKRADELAEEGTFEAAMGGVEVKKVSVLTGAETERQLLEQLLIKRAKFAGDTSNLLTESNAGLLLLLVQISFCLFISFRLRICVGKVKGMLLVLERSMLSYMDWGASLMRMLSSSRK